MKKSKVGRPKLADTNLKKKSLIISAICLIFVLALILTGIKILNITPNKLKGEAYKTYEVGEEFCLDTECFYVIEDNGDTLTALAKYNLLVGYIVYNNEYDENGNARIEKISETKEGYGLQNQNAKGYDYINEGDYSVGAVNFIDDIDNKDYWSDADNKLLDKYGNDYPAFVYDENSLIYSYVQSYEHYLNSIGYSLLNVTLINYEQVQKFGCGIGHYECYEAPEWFYSTTYWTGVSLCSNNIKAMMNDQTFDTCTTIESGCANGIRPVITIAKSDLIKDEELETTTTEATTTKKVETTTATTTTAKKATTSKNSGKKVTTITEAKKDEEETTTTEKVVVNKVVSTTKTEVKEEKSVPVVPIAIGGGVVAFAGIGYGIYLLKIKN